MRQEHSWSPPFARVATYGGASLVLVVCALLGAGLDQGGQLLVGVAAVILAGLAVRDAVARPTVRADVGGMEIRDGLGLHRLPWVAVLSVQVETVRRRRRMVVLDTLEVDTIDGLFVLSRRQLGSPPADVAAELEQLRLTSF
ncbi:MAG: PH domain-containing protein [Frankia sp.]